MKLSHALQQINHDLAYIAQVTDSYARQTESIKNKAEMGIVSTIDEVNLTWNKEYYLLRELFDLDLSLVKHVKHDLDISVKFLKNLYADPYPVNIGDPVDMDNIGQYYLIDVDVVSLGTTQETMFQYDGQMSFVDGSKMLVFSQQDAYLNGIYEYYNGSWRRYSHKSFNVTIHVLHGELYADTIWKSVLDNNRVVYFISDSYELDNKYKTVTDEIVDLVDSLKNQLDLYVESVKLLKLQRETPVVLEKCNTSLQQKDALDNSIEILSDELLNYNRFLSIDNYYDNNSSNIALYGKPHRPVDSITNKLIIDKLYNNNFSRIEGNGAGGTSVYAPSMTGGESSNEEIANIMKEGNAIANNNASMNEYWNQIGWVATERSGNYKQYVQLMEQDLKDRGLEQIVDMHGKASYDTYVRTVGQPEGYLHPLSPKPLKKEDRPKVDSTLAYNDYELLSGEDED